jgi:predicted nucleic acid-binding protein
VAILFLDSSAVVKLYAAEEHSSWTLDLVRGAGLPLDADLDAEGDEARLEALRAERAENAVSVSAIAWVECLAALAAKERVRALTRAERLLVEDALARDFSERFLVRPVTGSVLAVAGRLAALRALRAYDAVQLATALVLRSELAALAEARDDKDSAGYRTLMLSYDDALHDAAVAEGIAHFRPGREGGGEFPPP